jgi:hypothetical protein
MRALFGRSRPKRLVTTRVVNIHVERPDDLFEVCRPGPLGNPHSMVPGTTETRGVVIEKYGRHLDENPRLVRLARSLRGRPLGCFCHPRPCHGDVVGFVAEGITDPITAGRWVGRHGFRLADYAAGKPLPPGNVVDIS